MAITYQGGSTGGGFGTTNSTGSFSVTAGDLIVVGVAQINNGTQTFNTPTDSDGNTYTNIGACRNASFRGTLDIWYAIAAHNASITVTVTTGSSVGYSVIAQNYAGINATPLDQGAIGTSSSASSVTSASFTPATDGLAVAFGQTGNGAGTFTAGTGYTLRNNDSFIDFQSEDKITTGTGSQTASISYSTTDNAFISVALFKPAAGGAASPFFGNLAMGLPSSGKVARTQGFVEDAEIQLFGKDTFFGGAGEPPGGQREFPNPMGKRRPIDLLTFFDPSETWLLKDKFFGGAGQPPTNFNDWPNPTLKNPDLGLRTLLDPSEFWLLKDQFFGAAGQPPSTYDFPNPKGAIYPVQLRTWLISTVHLQPVIVQTPFILPFIPNPRGYPFPLELRTGIQSLLSSTLAPVIGQQHWPNPYPRSFPVDLRTWLSLPLVLTTLAPGQLIQDTDATALDWPNPRGYPYPLGLRTWLQSPLLGKDLFFGVSGQPPTNYDWPNPKGPRFPYPGFLRSYTQQSLMAPRTVPFTPSHWPNPKPLWTSSLLTLGTSGVQNLALYFPAPIPPVEQGGIDDDFIPGTIHDSHRTTREQPQPHVRLRQGVGHFPLGLMTLQGHGTVLHADDEDELLLFLLADEA